jgi:hypothetical protein
VTLIVQWLCCCDEYTELLCSGTHQQTQQQGYMSGLRLTTLLALLLLYMNCTKARYACCLFIYNYAHTYKCMHTAMQRVVCGHVSLLRKCYNARWLLSGASRLILTHLKLKFKLRAQHHMLLMKYCKSLLCVYCYRIIIIRMWETRHSTKWMNQYYVKHLLYCSQKAEQLCFKVLLATKMVSNSSKTTLNRCESTLKSHKAHRSCLCSLLQSCT